MEIIMCKQKQRGESKKTINDKAQKLMDGN